MTHTDIAKWQSVFDDLVLQLREAPAPAEQSGQWFEGLARYSRHSYARLLLCPQDGGLRLRLEVALGSVDDERPARGLSRRFESVTDTDWERERGDAAWILHSQLPEDCGPDRLRRFVLDLLEIAEHFDRVDSADEWLSVIRQASDGDETEQPDTETIGSSSADTPFESIGDGSSQDSHDDAPREATIEAVDTTRADDTIVAAIGFSQLLAPPQLEAVEQGLEHHLHTKFRARSRPSDAPDHGKLELGDDSASRLYLRVEPGDYSGTLSALRDDVDEFLERLERFSSLGVDLFEYLGVGETVFAGGEPAGTEEDDDEARLSFGPRTSSEPEPPPASRSQPAAPAAEDDDAIVLDLEAAEDSSDSLEAKNYTDPRLQREDATTPLVDVVLRHPGYSDRRIGQVLSILLSIEYHDAVDIADSAPCVIAWGVGQKRARRFKDVIESAGGKVVLVEPDTFTEE